MNPENEIPLFCEDFDYQIYGIMVDLAQCVLLWHKMLGIPSWNFIPDSTVESPSFSPFIILNSVVLFFAEWPERHVPRLGKRFRDTGWTFARGEPQTLCHLPHPVSRHLEDVQAGPGLILDGGRGELCGKCAKYFNSNNYSSYGSYVLFHRWIWPRTWHTGTV